jgi:5-methylthioribose kinase
VVLQLGSYRLRGKRWLRCAPLHHHFQFGGWLETAIVRRFWLAAGGCAALGVIGLIVSETKVAEFARIQKPAMKIQQVTKLLRVERHMIAVNGID